MRKANLRPDTPTTKRNPSKIGMIEAIQELQQQLRAGTIHIQNAVRTPIVPEFVLHVFACDCAQRTFLREEREGRTPHEELKKALQLKREWLMGGVKEEALVQQAAKALDLCRLFLFSTGTAAEISFFAAQPKAQDAALKAAMTSLRYVRESPTLPRDERMKEIHWQRHRLAWLLDIHEWAGGRLPFLLAEDALLSPVEAQLSP